MTSPEERRRRLADAGAWLRQQRIKRGFATGVEFAHALGVDKSVVSNYERGVSGVDDAMASRIADVLRLPEIDTRRALGLWVPDADRDDGGIDPELNERIDRLTERAEAILREVRELTRRGRSPDRRDERDAG